MLSAILLAAMAAAPVAAGPALTVVAAPRGYAITAPEFPATDSEYILAEQTKLAAVRCGSLKVRWGRFTYNTITRTVKDKVTSHIDGYRQNFSCFDPATDPYKPAPAGWKATAVDDAAALAFARRYLASYDTGNVTIGLPMMEPIMEVTRAEWLALGAGFRDAAGKGARTFGKVEWLINAEDMSHPGAFARIAFAGDYTGLAAHCGNLVLYRQSPTRYYVAQQNLYSVTRDEVAKGAISESNARKVCGG